MALQAAAMMAIFVDQAAQAPLQIRCVQQATPESWIRWLLQFVLSIVPVAGGVGIALWSFRKNRQAEHGQWVRNQKAGHEQWVRDQKKAEWKDLLVTVAEIEHEIPIAFPLLVDHTGLEPLVLGVLPRLRGTIFIYPSLVSSGFIEQWGSFVQYVGGRYMRNTIQSASQLDREVPDVAMRQRELSKQEEIEVREKFHGFMVELRRLAHSDLEIQEN